jgi:threonylcarbamoyladenosine tRNA methylthiotransferase MtaB
MAAGMRVAFTNLGCKLNQAELEDLARRFAAAGHRVVGSPAEAQLHVVNTCTVTRGAARGSRKAARRGRRLEAAPRTVLTGCYVESDPDEAARLAGVDLVVPNAAKEELVDRVHEAFPDLRPEAEPAGLPYAPLDFGNARALVKIEDGCDMRCAFCIIPSTRGRQRSRPAAEVVREVAALEAHGYAEVVLTGVQISSYRYQGEGLYELVARILAETPVRRLRLTSIAPWQFDPRLLDLFSGGRLCRHFHLSLQSGCDRTLRRMRRPYTADGFRRLLDGIRDRVPGVAITTDVIAGFPGETEEDDRCSRTFVERLGFARVHAFPYSERPGTAAVDFSGKLDPPAIRRRMEALLAVAVSSRAAFARDQVGRTVEVLWERRRDGAWQGTSDNYLRVRAVSERDLRRRLEPARLVAAEGDELRAQLRA